MAFDMARKTALCGAAFCLASLATAAGAQTERATALTPEEIESAEVAAERMYGGVYGSGVPAYMTVTEAIERLRELGYTGVDEVDVEWNHYEIEAYTPDGREVEIEFDPVTGSITDIEDNWF